MHHTIKTQRTIYIQKVSVLLLQSAYMLRTDFGTEIKETITDLGIGAYQYTKRFSEQLYIKVSKKTQQIGWGGIHKLCE